MFEEEIIFLNNVEDSLDECNERCLHSDDELEYLKVKYSNLPEEYLAYLKEIGSGSAREDQYMIYSQPSLCHEDTDFSWYETKGVSYLIIGDDFAGNLYAFNLDKDCMPVLLDHECRDQFPHKGSMKSFFREMMLMDENGNDQREP